MDRFFHLGSVSDDLQVVTLQLVRVFGYYAFDLKDWSDLESAWNTLRGKLGKADLSTPVSQKIAGLRAYYAREDDKRAAESETAAVD